MSDVTVLRADVFRPDAEGEFLVVMAKGGYGKDVHFRDAFGAQWAGLKEIYPCTDSDWTSGRYLPLRNGRSGTLGAGRFRRRNRSIPRHRKVSRLFRSIFAGGNPGLCRGHRLGRDSELVERKSGAFGGFLFCDQAVVGSRVAAAVSGGDHSVGRVLRFLSRVEPAWRYPRPVSCGMVARQILPNQHGNGEMALRDSESGENPNGAPLSSEMLEGNRPAFPDEILKHVLDDQWYRERTPDFSRVTVPILSAANWGGPG
jgi:hypothetical protein